MIQVSRIEADERDIGAMVPQGTSMAKNILLTSLPVSAAVSAAVYLISRSVWVAGGIGVGLAAASIVSNVRFFRGVDRRTRQKGDPRAVETIDVEASRALDIEPMGSHGPAYVFFSPDGKAILLIGQWLLEQQSFPCLSFRIRRWADTGKPIRIEPRGPAIDPEESPVQLPPTSRISDIELFDAAPDTLQDDLRRAFPLTSGRREQ